MIELSQIQSTSKLKELRGQINTMANEINGNQMVIGQVLHPTATIYSVGGLDVASITADKWVVNQLFAVCMPESNGVYIARVFGCLFATITSTGDAIESVDIDIPSVKLPNRENEVSTFISPFHLGFTPDNSNGLPAIRNTGLQFGVILRDSTESSIAVTDQELTSRTDATLLNYQGLVVSPTNHLKLALSQNLWP